MIPIMVDEGYWAVTICDDSSRLPWFALGKHGPALFYTRDHARQFKRALQKHFCLSRLHVQHVRLMTDFS